MIKVEINGKKYEFPNGWDDITMKQYCRLFHDIDTSGSKASDVERSIGVIKNEAKIISRLLGEDDDFVIKLPIEAFSMLQNEARFIYSIDGFINSGIHYLTIDGMRYWIPEPKDMSLRQYIDADMIMKDDKEDTFIELLSCLLLPMGKDGKYVYDGNYQELIPKIEKMKASNGLPFIYSFFKKKELSKKLSEVCSKVEEVASQLPHSTQGL